MDKKSANGFQTKAGEGGVQRKQLPYSVETPYGFHLDLDFLKYVDDIEKGNTIKRVHIQRRVKGPPKFSTLPRNFSLPGHGARPASKEKDSTWSGTSTLGPRPKSRVTEVQQLFDFRANDGGTSSQSNRGTTSPGGGYVAPKPRDEACTGARGVEEKTVGMQSRPNLLRASSMPVTLQQRKSSDSSSPDRVVGTPENGSTENIFRASPDVTERRCVPQDRTGLHQQITVALKRVRELEEMVKTIPELKAQISSLREEKERLLLELQVQTQAQISTSPSTTAPDAGSHTQPVAHRSSEGLSLAPTIQPAGVTSRVSQKDESASAHGKLAKLSAQESERLSQPSEKSDKPKEAIENPLEHAGHKLSQDTAGQQLTSSREAIKDAGTSNIQDAEKPRQPEKPDSVQILQEKLMILEDKLTQASQELDKTNSLLKEQIEDNMVKEEKILQLSEGVRVEIYTPEQESGPRRVSIDTGTVTERVDFANQETETESVGRVDKGTDTDQICVEVYVPSVSIDQVTEVTDTTVETQDQVTDMEAEVPETSPPRPRANSIERGTVTERIATQDQTTETPVAERVNQVTDMEAEVPATSPPRPRANSIERGTVTERIATQDQTTETPVAERVNQVTDVEEEVPTTSPPRPRANSMERGTVTERITTQDQTTETPVTERVNQVTDVEEEVPTTSSPRPRANSMERGTVTERITTQDQTTETPVAERVNQVTETEGETGTDQPRGPRASSADRGTETERVDTVDRVTETEVAQRSDQVTETETETERRPGNNPATGAEAESPGRESTSTERVEEVSMVVSESTEDQEESERIQRVSESVVMKVITESSVVVQESAAQQVIALGFVSQNEERTSPSASTEGDKESAIETSTTAQKDSETTEITETKSVVTETVEMKPIAAESQEKKETGEGEIVCVTVKDTVVTDVVVTAAEDAAVKTVVPVRPQRGRKLSAEPAPPTPPQPQAAPVRPRRGSSEGQAKQPQTKPQPEAQVQDAPQLEAQSPTQLPEQQVKHEAVSVSKVEDKSQAKRPSEESAEEKPASKPQAETRSPSSGSSGVQTRPKSIQSHSQTSAAKRGSKELKGTQRGSSVSQPPSRGSGETQTRLARQGSSDLQGQSQGSRKSSSETQPPHKDISETQSLRRASSETAKRRGSTEAQAARRDSGEAQTPRRGSGESPTSPAALGQVVTRLTGLLGEQWAQLGSSSGAQQPAVQQEIPSTQKQTAGKRAEAGKGAAAKPVGKAVPAAATGKTAGKPAGKTAGKPAGKAAPSKMSSIQSQLVSSLSVLSAFYSPAQKAAAAKKQQEQGLKSIMKKNGVADKQGTKGAKKNLKFVGVNGGYETTSSEESSGDEKTKVEVEVEVEEEENSSEPEVEKEKEKEKEKEPEAAEKPEEAAETQAKDAEVPAEGGGAAAGEEPSERGLMDPRSSQELQEEQAEREKVDKAFIDACIYVKDRMEEVPSPDKEMRQVLVVLYQEWFKVSSQKDSQADTVRLYLRQVGLTTPTLLPYVVNLTDGNGNMALHYSVSHSNFPVVELLLDTGLCETNNVNKAGYTPVMLAALTAAESPGDLEVAQQLLRLGDVNARSRQAGQTALMLAVSHGRVAMVKLLLSSGADVNAQDREGSTALMCASEHGHVHIARLLLETGRCDAGLVDKNGQTALSVAEATSHPEIVDLLKAQTEGQASGPPAATDLL